MEAKQTKTPQTTIFTVNEFKRCFYARVYKLDEPARLIKKKKGTNNPY